MKWALFATMFAMQWRELHKIAASLFIMNKSQLLYNVEGIQHPCIPVVHALAKGSLKPTCDWMSSKQNMSSSTAEMLTENSSSSSPTSSTTVDEERYQEPSSWSTLSG